MSLKQPALDPATVQPRTGSGYPEPYRSRCLPREKRARVIGYRPDDVGLSPRESDLGGRRSWTPIVIGLGVIGILVFVLIELGKDHPIPESP